MAAGLALAASAAPAQAQDDPTGADQAINRPASAGRIVRYFDFEERVDTNRDDFNPEAVPRHWVRAQHDPPERERPGFPLSNKAGYDTTIFHQGGVSIKLPVNGGSTSLRLANNLLPIFPGADYQISAFVRTEGLTHARALLTAQFLDPSGKPIAGASRRSEPMLSTGTWSLVRLELPGIFDNAAFVQVEMLVEQQAQFAEPPPSGRHHAWAQDYNGAAWFDDIGILQLPRVSLNTPSPSNVYVSDTPPPSPLLTAVVQDLAGEETTARLSLFNIRDELLATISKPLPPGGGQFGWSPTLPEEGFYRSELEVISGETVIGRGGTQFLWIKPPTELRGLGVEPPTPYQARRFGIAVNSLENWQRRLAPELLAAAGVGSASLVIPPIGDRRPDADAIRRDYQELLDELLARGLDLTVALESIDPKLAAEQRLDPQDPMALLSREEALWLPTLRGMLDQYGQRIRRWQVGTQVYAETIWRPDLNAALARFRTVLSRLVPGPRLTIPWRAEWGWPQAMSALDSPIEVSAISFPSSFPASSVPATVSAWARAAGRDPRAQTAVLIDPGDEQAFGQEAVLIESLQRALLVWAAMGPERDGLDAPATQLLLPQPWRDDGQTGLHRQVLPSATLAGWRTLVDHLAGRKVIGTLPTPPGVRCLILADLKAPPGSRGSGALVIWSDGPPSSASEPGTSVPGTQPGDKTASAASGALVVPLGQGRVVRFDPFGNSTPLQPMSASGLYRLTAEPMPAFIEGVDAELVLFMQGLRVDPPFVPAVAAEHQRELIITNPWPIRITGDVQFLQPPSASKRSPWRFAPTAPVTFSIAAGETSRIPFAFAFGASEEAGTKQLTMIVRLNTDRPLPPLRVSTALTIGLDDLQLVPNILASPGPNGPDLTVVAVVTNTGATSRTLRLNVQAPGFAGQEQPISNLAPADTATRRFVIPNSAAALSGKRIRVTVADIDGAERLNKSVQAP